MIELAGPDSPFVTRAMVESLPRTRGPPAPARRDPFRIGPGSPPTSRPRPLPYHRPGFELLREGFEPLLADRDPLLAYGGLFASRFGTLSRILRGRSGLPDLTPIGTLRNRDGEMSVIGMVRGDPDHFRKASHDPHHRGR